jgi:hypothetical protein
MSNIIQRITNLLTLAANSGAAENEARNASLEAARLITKHNLQVVDAFGTTARPPNHETSVWQVLYERERERTTDLVNDLNQKIARRKAEARAVAKEPAQCGSCGEWIPEGSPCFDGPRPHRWRCVPCANRNAPRYRSKRKPATTA